MAVIISFNCHNKPVSAFPKLQNPKNFDSLKFRGSVSYPPTRTRERRLAVKGLRSSSDPNGNESEKEPESLGVKTALSILRFYKREISPLLPKSCRYVPTCSEYSMEAYKKYGALKGTILTASRLCRCNPLGGSGFDPPRWFDEPRPNPPEE